MISRWLKSYLAAYPNDWDEALSVLLLQRRETMNDSLGFSCAEIVFSRHTHGPLYLAREVWEYPEGPKMAGQKDLVTYIQELRDFSES